MTTDPAPLRTISIANVDGDLVDEVRAALSAEVTRAQRAATRAAAELVAETEKDPRSGALAIARSLATAARLAEFAENLLSAWAAGGPGLPAGVAADLGAEADAVVKPRRRTKAQIAADVAAQAAAAAANAAGIPAPLMDRAVDAVAQIRGDAGEPPPPGATREEVIAATRAELDRLNGPEDPEPPAPAEVIPTLEEAARAIEAQGPKPEPGDRPASDDVAEALNAISAPEPAGA